MPLRNTSRANFSLHQDGLIKLLYEPASDKVIAAHLVSPTAGDVIQILSVAIRLGVAVDDLATSIHVFPAFTEIVKGVAEQAVPASAAA